MAMHIMKQSATLSLLRLWGVGIILAVAFGLVHASSSSVAIDRLDSTADVSSLSSSASRTTICLYLADGVYETRHLPIVDAQSYLSLGVALEKACICPSLCSGYSTYTMTDNRCTCLTSTKAYKLSLRRLQVNSATDDFFDEDPNDIDDCDDDDECDDDSPCAASNQICTKRDSDTCFCKPITCASSPHGGSSPCGPDSACTDTPSGYTCTKFILAGCRAGCGPNAFCNTTATSFPTCSCLVGFHRPVPYLGCVPL